MIPDEYSPSSSRDLSRIQPIRTHSNGIPVLGFGDTYIYAISPDFNQNVKLQGGNTASRTKIQPLPSSKIRGNLFGTTPPRMPRTQFMDFQPLLPINLIDGDSETYWCSRGQAQPDVEPVWIRIDLAREVVVKAVRFKLRHDRLGTPENLIIQVSRDAWHWDKVCEAHGLPAPTDKDELEFEFRPRPAKQVWIIGEKFQQLLNFGYCFSLAEVEVLAEDGSNVALVSNGGSVTVSSTNPGYGTERLLHENLWSTHADLGLKWIRVGYWDDVLNWHHVEREKGKLIIDPRADDAITECAENGMNIVLCLAYNNWLYTPEGQRSKGKQLWEVPYDMTPRLPTDTPAMMEGFKNYVRFMVRHFRDRVQYFEIWNEQNLPLRHWGRGYAFGETPEAAREFSQLVKEVAPIIREEAPEAKIMLGSTGGLDVPFTQTCFEEGCAPLVDAIGWHPFYQLDPQHPYFLNYSNAVEDFKKLAASYGFHGEYMATEWAWSAAYPPLGPPVGAENIITELTKAKYLARVMVLHAYMDIISFWNETWCGCRAGWSIGLFRHTFASDPLQPTQPEPAYYVLRTLCTVFDNAKPVALDVNISTEAQFVTLEHYCFEQDGAKLLALWAQGPASDDFRDAPTEVILSNFHCDTVTAIDILNGFEQPLKAQRSTTGVRIQDVLVKDYPIILRLQ